MGHGVSGGAKQTPSVERVEKIKHGITLTDVIVRERILIVDIPKINWKEETRTTVKYRPITEETTKYITREQETVKYRPVEKETVIYVPREKVCEKPVVVEKTYEKPVIVEKVYEKPVIKEKEIEVVTVKDVKAVKDMAHSLEELTGTVESLKKQLDGMKNYKLIEKVIQVPKLE